MPGRVLNELPVHLHVLINHKMSPRGRIKLSVSVYLLPYLLPILSLISYALGISIYLFTWLQQNKWSPSLSQRGQKS